MSLRTVELDLDRPRHLQFTLSALRDCCRRLGGITFLQLLQRLEGLDFEALVQAVHCGLRHEDRKLDLTDVERILQQAIDRDGSITRVLQAVGEAIELSGMLRRSADGAAAGDAEGKALRPGTGD